ncbi:ABC transporter substrate-binding protein [Paenibacillus pasadenensis]|uniref:ABC transporter substrate-binding protein n=1 Tax=Paenibacillus pasadenensis TaxID=217090 RepID=UPI002040FA8F|nr:ABC transporter substrate-binding protein [Paenibacillus pasadenensis]MCM3746081.1 ABC transporter substrate-binding protein [Paenibacillus pasadenensis]
MGKRNNWMKAGGLLTLALTLGLAGCGGNEAGNTGGAGNAANEQPAASEAPLQKIKVVLDWTPNTNHTGLYVARDKGYFKNHGLDVEIVQPPEGTAADTLVAKGEIEFGVGYQESLTTARTQGLPLVSLAAIIQHNTSGFASPEAKGIKSPKDFEGKTYGGWGAPVEQEVISSLMQEQGADVNKVKIVNLGNSDFFTAVKRDIDFAWIYYAWTGVEAELRGEKLNMVYLTDFSDKLDYYTPLLQTNETMIAEKPELVKAFVAGAAEGYQYAIDNPEDAAEVLIKAVPDLDPELVRASQKWLSPKYQDDAPRWGEQKAEVWNNYADWMFEHKLLESKPDLAKAFTNDYLPQK